MYSWGNRACSVRLLEQCSRPASLPAKLSPTPEACIRFIPSVSTEHGPGAKAFRVTWAFLQSCVLFQSAPNGVWDWNFFPSQPSSSSTWVPRYTSTPPRGSEGPRRARIWSRITCCAPLKCSLPTSASRNLTKGESIRQEPTTRT